VRLLTELERLLAAEESLFRRQLLREDIARLHKLQALARTSTDLSDFIKGGMLAGWTQANARTHELREPLEALLEAIYALERDRCGEAQEARVVECWHSLHRLRMERLLGCLATPAPKPLD
jgi:hypothetical protein